MSDRITMMTGEIRFGGDAGPTGPQGIQGIKGDKPVVGVDYFTESDKAQMVKSITDDANSEFNQNAKKRQMILMQMLEQTCEH